jgi:hypothetical protein
VVDVISGEVVDVEASGTVVDVAVSGNVVAGACVVETAGASVEVGAALVVVTAFCVVVGSSESSLDEPPELWCMVVDVVEEEDVDEDAVVDVVEGSVDVVVCTGAVVVVSIDVVDAAVVDDAAVDDVVGGVVAGGASVVVVVVEVATVKDPPTVQFRFPCVSLAQHFRE